MAMETKQMTMQQVVAVMLEVGFQKIWRSVECLSVIWAGSGGNVYAITINDDNPDNINSYLSIDMGLCQLNSRCPSLTSQQALNPQTALKTMFDKTGGWRYNKTLWNAYNNGEYQKYLHDARNAFGL